MPSTCGKTTFRIQKEHGPAYKTLRGKGELHVTLERFLLGA